MQADTIELLTTKGRFPAEQALAVAEAIDMGIRDAQLVTVPIFLAAESKTEARFAKLEARMDAQSAEVGARFTKLEARIGIQSAEIGARFAEVEAKMAASDARMDQKLDRLRLQLIIAIVIASAMTGPLGIAALDALKRAF